MPIRQAAFMHDAAMLSDATPCRLRRYQLRLYDDDYATPRLPCRAAAVIELLRHFLDFDAIAAAIIDAAASYAAMMPPLLMPLLTLMMLMLIRHAAAFAIADAADVAITRFLLRRRYYAFRHYAMLPLSPYAAIFRHSSSSLMITPLLPC